MPYEIDKHFIVSLSRSGAAFISELGNVQIYQEPNELILTDEVIPFTTMVKAELGTVKIVDYKPFDFNEIAEEEILDLIKE